VIAPFLHAVPVATGCMTTLDPLLHIPNWVPSALHTIWPGEEQDLEPAAAGASLGAAEPVEAEVELVPERGGVLGDTAGAGAFGEGEARIVAVPGVAAVPLGAPDVEFPGVEPLDDDDEPESLVAPPAKLTLVFSGHVPCGGAGAELPFWSSDPGFGNSRSALSVVLQPSPRLATNI